MQGQVVRAGLFKATCTVIFVIDSQAELSENTMILSVLPGRQQGIAMVHQSQLDLNKESLDNVGSNVVSGSFVLLT
jgi:hypothetical protein